MKMPTATKLSAVFGNNAKAARAILMATRDELLETNEVAQELARQCYNKPPEDYLKMHVLNALGCDKGSFHGIESASVHGCRFSFLNAGDSYTDTLVLMGEDYMVASYGDMVEKLEKRAFKNRTGRRF